MNVTFGGSGRCGVSNNPYPAAIIHYDGASNAHPTNPGVTPVDHQCLDLINLTPVVTRTVSTSSFSATANDTLDVVLTPTLKWTVANSSLVVDWNNPVVQYALNNETDWPSSDNVWQINKKNEVGDSSCVGPRWHARPMADGTRKLV